MSQIKLAGLLMIPLAFHCSAATAQEIQPGCPTTGTAPSQFKPQTQMPSPLMIQPRPDEVYGPYIPYSGPLLQKTPPPQREVAEVPSTACITPNAQIAHSSSLPSNSSAVLQQIPQAESNGNSQSSKPWATGQSTADELVLTADSDPSTGASSSTSEYVRSVPLPRAAMVPVEIRPFRSIAIGVKADTLGAGFEIATPVAHNLNLRSSINIFAFDDPFNIDGVNYDARLHLKSSETTLDLFLGHGLHISPGILYAKNTMSAPASVGPGQTFVLGSQTFLNSVDDPVSGSSSVVYPHTFSPMLLIGVGNIIPRSGRHFSVPFEIGAAYTGAPKINVGLSGTACTTEGCVNFAQNSEAQTALKQEINILNEDLKRVPIFPIISLGFAYHF
jgi:hypothetical protein